MLTLIRIVSRNLLRNRRRTLLTFLGMALGVALCGVAYGILDGMNEGIVRSVTDLDGGHVQVHHRQFLAQRALRFTLDASAPLLAKIRGVAGVEAASPRLYAWMMISSPRDTVGAQVTGIDPLEERRVTLLAERVVSGAFLPAEPVEWPERRPPTPAERSIDDRLTESARAEALAEIEQLSGSADSPSRVAKQISSETRALLDKMAPGPVHAPPALLGADLARRLGLRVGDELQLTGQDSIGAPVQQVFRLVGLLRTGNDAFDRTRVFLHLGDMSRWLDLSQRAHEIVVRARSPMLAKATAASLRKLAALNGLEVDSWQALRPDVLAMEAANEALMGMLVFIILGVAGFGVLSTMLMVVFERRRELGVLQAIGMRPRKIVTMVVLEALLLGICGALIGSGLGLGLNGYLALWGWQIRGATDFSLVGVSVQPVLRAAVTLRGVAIPALAMCVLACLGALFPAWLAARVEPAAAVRGQA